MAIVTSFGIDGAVAALKDADLFDTEAEKEMLFAAGDILADNVRAEMLRSGYHMEGIAENAKCKHILRKTKDGYNSVVVSVYGKNANGTRNAIIAFVLNYGRRKKCGEIRPSHYWSAANAKAEPAIAREMERIAEKFLRERGSI